MKRIMIAVACTILWLGTEWMLYHSYSASNTLFAVNYALYFALQAVAYTTCLYIFVDGVWSELTNMRKSIGGALPK